MRKIVLAAALLLLPPGGSRAQEQTIYNKTLPGGAEVKVTRQAVTEFRTRPAAANPGVPAEELFADQEWRHVAYAASLRWPDGREERLVWEKWIEYQVAPKYSLGSPEIHVVDTLLRGGSLYILYVDAHLYTVEGRQKKATATGSEPRR